MKKIVYLIILVGLLPFSAFSQQNKKVKDALTYINQQFKEYNEYNMQWKVDETKKTITSTSIYYKITYPLASISSIDYIIEDKVIEFTCNDDDNCISLFDLDNSTTSTKSTNRANLTSGTTIGKKVVEAFYTIQSELVGNNGTKTTDQPNSSNKNDKIKKALTYINEQFKEYNAYNMQWKVDEIKKTVISTSTYYKITYPLTSIETIEYIASDQVMEFTCKGDKSCISLFDLDNSTTSTKSSNRANLTSGASIGNKVADAFLTIQSELLGKTETKTTSTDLPNAPIKNANVKKALTYINTQFKEYNAYDMQWGVDETNKILVSKSKYFRVEYPLNAISNFKYKNEIVTLTCSDEDECITSLDLDYKTTSNKSSNTVNLTSGDEIGQKVIDAFYTIQSELTGGGNINVNNNINDAAVDEALDYINSQFEIYNAYDVQFSLDKNNGNLKSKSKYFLVTYPIKSLKKIVLYKRDVKDYLVEFYCKNDGSCIKSKDLESDDVSTQSSYSVNLTSSQVIGDKVIASFLTIVKAYGGKLTQDDDE